MAAVDDFTAGGYRFIPGGFQFSGGVAATQGFEIKRFRFRTTVPLADGFARIEKTIMGAGRPLTAFCACELRSPGQFTEQGFRAFNEAYVVTLQKWGVFDGKVNPVLESHKRTSPELMPVLTHLGPAAPCGLTTYESNVFGPGYRDNLRPLLWLLRLREGEVRGRQTPVGIVPVQDELDLDGVAIAPRDLETILTIDTPRWKQEMKHREQHLEQFPNLPEEIWQAHYRVEAALDDTE